MILVPSPTPNERSPNVILQLLPGLELTLLSARLEGEAVHFPLDAGATGALLALVELDIRKGLHQLSSTHMA